MDGWYTTLCEAEVVQQVPKLRRTRNKMQMKVTSLNGIYVHYALHQLPLHHVWQVMNMRLIINATMLAARWIEFCLGIAAKTLYIYIYILLVFILVLQLGLQE